MKRFTALILCLGLCLSLGTGCSVTTSGTTAAPAATTSAAEVTTAVEATEAAVATEATEAALAEGVLSEEEATLKIYAQYSDDDTKVPYDYAVEQMAIAYPNVKLELEVQAQDDGQKLMTYAATGNLPDIFQVSSAQIENFKESGNIMVLND